jgi:hypothetical protein
MKLQTIETLQSSLTQLKSQEMPLRLSYKFSKLLSKIEKDSEFFTEKTREVILKYAEKDENGDLVQTEDGNIRIQTGKIEEANKAMMELNDIEVEDINITFTLDELESLSIAPEVLQPLLPLIVEDENKD